MLGISSHTVGPGHNAPAMGFNPPLESMEMGEGESSRYSMLRSVLHTVIRVNIYDEPEMRRDKKQDIFEFKQSYGRFEVSVGVCHYCVF
jgi:hypothetical protein